MSRKQNAPELTATAEGTEVVRPRPSHDARPLDWGHAVDAAAARLEESWVSPDLTGYMAASGLADEFAATLCAYGMVADEVAHMHDRMDETPIPLTPTEPTSPILGVAAREVAVAK
jgi:hypothetical protein